MANEASMSTRLDADSPRGFAFALAAYLLWGFLPLYMKAVAHIPPAEVIAHRVVWSVPIAGAVLLILGRTSDLKTALRSPRMLGMAAVTASIITINWGIYVWAIGSGHAIETALGYFINPLISVFVGAAFLKEKLSRAQIASIGLAALAVVILTVEAGRLPWVALGLAGTWAIYAYLRKTLPVGPNQGFFLEVLILLVPALGYMIYLEATGKGHFVGGTTTDALLLVAAGLVTAGPLMIYANGAKLLKLSTIGIMQYIAPSLIFLTAVFVFREPFGGAKLIAFPMIWTALAIYTVSMLRQARARD